VSPLPRVVACSIISHCVCQHANTSKGNIQFVLSCHCTLHQQYSNTCSCPGCCSCGPRLSSVSYAAGYPGFFSHCGVKDLEFVADGVTWVGQLGLVIGLGNIPSAAVAAASPRYYQQGCEGPVLSYAIPQCERCQAMLPHVAPYHNFCYTTCAPHSILDALCGHQHPLRVTKHCIALLLDSKRPQVS
jgi:hypothetical protein